MTWLDFLCLSAFIGLTVLSSKRGIIMEVTDLVCILVGGFFAFRTFRPLASLLHDSVLSAFSISFLHGLCIFLTFTTAFLTIFGSGLTFQRKVKENKTLDPDVDTRLAIVVGVFKSLVVIQLFLGLIFYNNAFPRREIRPLKGGPIVSKILGLSAVVKPIVYIVAPGDLADGFMNKGLDPNNVG